ncbi:MAG: PQQ-dependent sugar dehydrogenase [Gemmatimonadetes bacterium]|nr:PQQ-dependent sugar dehydrogenase [Gemmatimonadota bacterium]
MRRVYRAGPLVAALWAGSPTSAPAQAPTALCDPDNAGLTLQPGFCAFKVVEGIGRARHLVVAQNGDIFVAIRGDTGGVMALRDTTGDGRADIAFWFARTEPGGTGIAFAPGYLYFAPDNAVLRYRYARGLLHATGAADTIVRDLPADRSHRAKSIALGPDGSLYVNIGAPSNACQREDRKPGSPGLDPCPDLDRRAGIWRFDANGLGQRQEDGQRFATGLRNIVALALGPDGALYGVQHGRDQLYQNWPAPFDSVKSAENPAEEFVRIERGDDFGWPYCYYDVDLRKKVLAPEYGGDGKRQDRCAKAKNPILGLPAHWAPDGLVFYSGVQFPARYRGGAFVAFRGSWNRAPLPQDGYRVVFVPFSRRGIAGAYETFADGFAGPEKSPQAARHRPTGLAEGPHGSLYVADDQGGAIFRIVYVGSP